MSALARPRSLRDLLLQRFKRRGTFGSQLLREPRSGKQLGVLA